MNSEDYNLLRELLVLDFKQRYYGSILGVFWVFAKPFLLFAVLLAVFSFVARFPMENYSLFLLAGIIFWNLFAEATTRSIFAISTKAGLIKKAFFPRELLIYSACLNSLLSFGIGMLALLLFAILLGTKFSFSTIWFIVPALALLLFSIGIALLLASMYVKAKDTQHVWEVLLQLAFWLTPIVYPISILPEKIQSIVLLNPLATTIGDARDIFLGIAQPGFQSLAIDLFFCALVFFLGLIVFKKVAPKIAEEL